MKDVMQREFTVNDHVGVAFSYNQASVGHIRTGFVELIDLVNNTLLIRWDEDGRLSKPVKYGSNTRWIKL